MTSTSLKQSIESSARGLFFGSRLFPVVRDAYQSIFDREKLSTRQKMLSFYGAFVSPGDLVFDVGANVGLYSDVFQALGARVIAVEPNPVCCEKLKLIAKRSNLIIENCAVGSELGTATMNLCADPRLSTLSNDWYETAKSSPVHGGLEWSGSMEVKVTTLDVLAQKYGVPAFVKIDVEGFEDRVIGGMSFSPKALNFEFHTTLLNVATSCLNNRVLRDGYCFNYIEGIDPNFRLPSWVSASQMEKILTDEPHEEYGDVFCKIDK